MQCMHSSISWKMFLCCAFSGLFVSFHSIWNIMTLTDAIIRCHFWLFPFYSFVARIHLTCTVHLSRVQNISLFELSTKAVNGQQRRQEQGRRVYWNFSFGPLSIGDLAVGAREFFFLFVFLNLVRLAYFMSFGCVQEFLTFNGLRQSLNSI